MTKGERIMKIDIDTDEYYPFHTVFVSELGNINIGPRKLKRWRKIMVEFEKVQEEMKKALKESKND